MKICNKCKIEKTDDFFEKNRAKCKECRSEYKNQYYLNNKEKIKQWREKNKENRKNYYLKNKKRILEQQNKYYLNNKEQKVKTAKKYEQYRRNNDTLFKFKKSVRCLIRDSFRRCNHNKTSKTVDILACSIEEFKSHIERQFTKGMTWEKLGEIHLDHIIPLATAKTEEDVIRLNHYTNFQPLWAKDNLKKSDKIVEKQLVLI
jgi:hypothetical protein